MGLWFGLSCCWLFSVYCHNDNFWHVGSNAAKRAFFFRSSPPRVFVDYYFSQYSMIRDSFFASLTVNSASLGRGAMPLKPVFWT